MTELMYHSTRNKTERITASQAILKGIAADGGLYVPEYIPQVDFNWTHLGECSYQEIAYEVLRHYLTDFTEGELRTCIAAAYDERFDDTYITPLVSLNEQLHVLELFHGSTGVFKDIALSILPHLMTHSTKKNHLKHQMVILTASAGNTGKAVMSGFADVERTQVIVFYPKDYVTPIQAQQLLTQSGDNETIIGVEGTFDDVQAKVKALLANEELQQTLAARGFQFSSANSINIGRIIVQMVYYVFAYAQLVKRGAVQAGEAINIAVPTGNFGNILSGYYAKMMGVPIAKLLCATNLNNVLVDFFHEGLYNRHRPLIATSSPAMDVRVASNLERLVYELVDEQDTETTLLMQTLEAAGAYELSGGIVNKLQDFYVRDASEGATARAIKRTWEQHRYVIEPHTATAFSVYKRYVEQTNDRTPTIVMATATPYKFPRIVMETLSEVQAEWSDFDLLDQLHAFTGLPVPTSVATVRKAPILHRKIVPTTEMKRAILDALI
ncbi:threonine synthase [Aerococcaceae bacterium NML160702]|nr:threonine synthase [Aerococcaceae bacterium NML160702]